MEDKRLTTDQCDELQAIAAYAFKVIHKVKSKGSEPVGFYNALIRYLKGEGYIIPEGYDFEV